MSEKLSNKSLLGPITSLFATIKVGVFLQLLIQPFLSITAIASPFPPTVSIGVIQLVEHPALDQTRKGILDELVAQGLDPQKTLQWQWESAQGNPSLATQIAQKFVGQQVTMIAAIATVPAQAALSVTKGSMIPVVYSSVTDPKGAKLEGPNITGVSNFIPVNQQLAFIKKVVPSVKRIGVIYNPGEANSRSVISMMEAEAKNLDLEIVTAPATKTCDVLSAAQSLMGKVDTVFINNDNTALAAFDAVAKACSGKVPLFTSDTDVLEKGAIAAIGPNQYQLGRQTGRMIAQLLKGETQIQTTPTAYPETVEIHLNQKAAQMLGIKFSDDLKKSAQRIAE